MTITRVHVERETSRRLTAPLLAHGRRHPSPAPWGRPDVDRSRCCRRGPSVAPGSDRGWSTRHQACEVLTAIGVALGADLGVRYFAGDRPSTCRSIPGADGRNVRSKPASTLGRSARSASHPSCPRSHRCRPDRPIVAESPSRQKCSQSSGDSSSRFAGTTRKLTGSQLAWRTRRLRLLAPRYPGCSCSARRSPPARSRARYEATLAAAYPARTEDVFQALTTEARRGRAPGSSGCASRPGRRSCWLIHRGACDSVVDVYVARE